MKVVTYVSKTKLVIIFTVVSIVALTINIYNIRQIGNTKDYILTKAVVMENKEIYHDEDSSRYIVVKFDYNGAEYTAEKQVTNFNGKGENSIINVKFDPKDPTKLENTYALVILIPFNVITAFFLILIILSIIYGKSPQRSEKFYDGKYIVFGSATNKENITKIENSDYK